MTIYFDDSLPAFAALIERYCGASALAKNFFLRDASGKLTFVVDKKGTASSTLAENAVLLHPYVDQFLPIATADELFDDRLRDPKEIRVISIAHPEFNGTVRLVDRRMVGADWLRSPSSLSTKPPRLAFSSIKGGVGRSTALCVLATHLAAHGKRVLAIDMDLEAPGLGNMLLPGETLPEFGLLDYLVESSLGNLDENFLSDIVGSSWIGGSIGRVDVIPAIGQRSLATPQNVLAKIARAYLADSSDGGLTFTDQLNSLLERVVGPNQYDIVLLDARAGLHETTAAAVVGMGAHVLLFGIDQPQTFAGYNLLFSHLGTLPRDAGDWISRLTFVHAKNSGDGSARFDEEVADLYQKHLRPPATQVVSEKNVETQLDSLKEEFVVDWSENPPDSEINAVLNEDSISVTSIYESVSFQKFDPIAKTAQLDLVHYKSCFGEFLTSVVASLDLKIDEE